MRGEKIKALKCTHKYIIEHYVHHTNHLQINMAEKKRIMFIVNPVSGTSGKKKYIQKLIKAHLDKEAYDFEIVKTEYGGHATELAKKAAEEGADIVCAIGGDGTVNEVASGLLHTKTALAIIPSGSGNGLARHLRIPTEPQMAIDVINKGLVQSMDYGTVNDKPFFCTCGVGFDAFISQRFAESDKRGPITYIENVLNTSLKYHSETYDVEIVNGDDNEGQHKTFKAFLISCANASQYGNNAYIAPEASVRDGVMNVIIIEPFSPIDVPQLAIQLFNGTITQNSHIKTFKCKKLIIHRSKPGAVHYDGDPTEMGETVSVELVAGGLMCVSPQEEGVPDMEKRVQSFFIENFHNMYNRTEAAIQQNLHKGQTLLNNEFIRKISGK